MGNESPQIKTRHRNNKNSFSVDFGHELPGKIKPNNTFKLVPIPDPKDNRSSSIILDKDKSQISQANNDENIKRQNGNKLKKLTMVNDQLRKQLIRISTQLTQRLKKKKYQVKKVEVQDKNANKKQSWKKQLQNAYRQIDMYKRQIIQYKQSQKSEGRVTSLENKISTIDLQIQKILEQIQATKKVTANQYAGIKKNQVQQNVQELKSQVQSLRLQLKQMSKMQRQKQKKYMQQHHYMSALEMKVKQLNGQTQNEIKKSRAQQNKKPSQQQYQQAQQQIQLLKMKHDQYHKKINNYLTNNRILKQQKIPLKASLEEKKKTIQNLKYKRDALVKIIKDNLYLFAAHQKKQHQQQQLSQFQTEQQHIQQQEQQQPGDPSERINLIQNQSSQQQQQTQQQQQQRQQTQKVPEEQRGTFDIAHLLDRNISKQSIQKRKALRHQQFKSNPKVWVKQLTRIISKGKSMADEKPFTSGIKQPNSKSLQRIVKLHVWMNKKKQITSIQPVYLVDGVNIEGNKSANNLQDEYRVSFQLQDQDYLKSILGIIGKQGYLDYLVLQSYFGKITKIGRQQTFGENFAVGIAKQQTPIVITGACRFDGNHWRINRIEIQVLIQSAH